MSALVTTPGATLAVNLSGAPSGLSMGVTVIDTLGDVVTTRTTTGVLETPHASGSYFAVVTAPATGGDYEVLWDTGAATRFTVQAPQDLATVDSEPRIVSMVRHPTRAYGYAERSVQVWLVDVAYLIREIASASTDDGTPVEVENDFGPYACRLSQAQVQETREPDHYVEVGSHTLLISTDLVPFESDYFDVICQDPTRDKAPVGVKKRYRVISGVEARAPAWRDPLVYAVPLQITGEA